MPIMGLSDRASLDPRFKEIGRIRKGAAKSGNRPGRDLDHFRYVPDSRHQESAKVFRRIYGEEPTSLEVHFPFDDTERVFGSWREAYGQNRLCKLRCDGARWHDWIEGDRHRHSTAGRECDLECRDTPNRCPDCPLTYVGRLSVILVPMWEAGQIGMITVITSSINDIANLTSKLVQHEPLTNKPFTLWRETERIGAPINGKRAGIDSDLLHLELAESRFLKEFQAAQRRSDARLMAPQPVPVARIEARADAPPDIDFDGGLIEDYERETGDELLNGDFHGTRPDPDTREELREEPERKAWPSNVLAVIITKKLAENTPNARGMLNLSKVIQPSDEADLILEWAGNYRTYRKAHEDEKPTEAAAWADEQMKGIEAA